MKMRALDHLVLCVHDVAATRQFYERVLGMDSRERAAGRVVPALRRQQDQPSRRAVGAPDRDRHGAGQLATELFGFSEDEALGATLDLIVPPDYREGPWRGFHAAMEVADGVVDHGSFNVPALHKDGRRIRLEVHLNVIHDSRGRVVGAFSAFNPDEGSSESIEPL